MAGGLTELTDAEFDGAVAKGVVLVDFWAPWCGPCQMQGPILQSLAGKIGAKAKIAKVNVDDHTAAAGKFGVQSIPTLILFKDGKEIKRYVGVQQEDVLSAAIDAAQ